MTGSWTSGAAEGEETAGGGAGVEVGEELWTREGVVGGVCEAGEGGDAHEVLVLGESLGLRVGPESESSLLRRPSFLRASMRTFWGSMKSA